MKIRTKLYISSGISVFLVLTLVLVVLITSNEISRETKELDLTENVLQSVSEIDILTSEYFLFQEERMEQQWRLKYNSMGVFINSPESYWDDDEEKEFVITINNDYMSLGSSFSDLVANYDAKKKLIQENSPLEEIKKSELIEERIISKMLVTSRSMISNSLKLSDFVKDELRESQELSRNLILIVSIILATILIFTSIFAAKRISDPIVKLTRSIEEITKGKLDIQLEGSNIFEIQSLTNSLDRILASLKLAILRIGTTKEEIGLGEAIKEKEKEIEDKYKLIVKNSSGMFYIGKQDWSAEIIANSELVCGYSIKDFSKKKVSWADLIYPKDKKIVFKQGSKLIRKPGSIIQRYRIIDKNKNVRTVEDRKTSVFKSGKLQGVYGIVYDITKQVKKNGRSNNPKEKSLFRKLSKKLVQEAYREKALYDKGEKLAKEINRKKNVAKKTINKKKKVKKTTKKR